MNIKSNIEQITRFKTPEESPGYALWRVSTAWRSHIEDALKPFELTHPQFVVLAGTAWLTRKGECVSQVDVSQFTGLDQNTASQVLRTLEKKKLICRMQITNERSKNPTATQQGLELLETVLPAVERADTQFFEKISSTQLETLVKFFKKCKS